MKENAETSVILELRHVKDLLKQEYDFEREAYKLQMSQIDILKSVKRGTCWFPVRLGRSYYNSLNQYVIEIFRDEASSGENHEFEFGKPVVFFSADTIGDGIHYFHFPASVCYVEENRMVVALPGNEEASALQLGGQIGIRLSFDETSYQLMFEAMSDVITAKNNRLAELRDLFYTNKKAEKFQFAPLRFPWLNKAQEKAVNEVLWAKDVSIVHGPPGTGKTTTLVEAIYETLRRESQVLVCSQSNMAVDWISEQLVDRGINVLRIGNPTRVNDKMLSFTYERQFENHPDYDRLWAFRRNIRALYDQRKKNSDKEAISRKISSLKEKAGEIEFRIKYQLFGEARVIACTLTGSANKVLTGMKFSTLFIDEAAQALEPACWIAIRKASRVILAGDHMQLPPTIKCYEAARNGLSKTLMEKIVERKPEVVTLLTTQYRMNEMIMKFSSDYFYNGLVQSAPDVKYRSILDFDTPVDWIDTGGIEDGYEQSVNEGYGRFNKAEAILTLSQLKDYITRIGKERLLEERIDFGIITPYRAQVQLLRRLLKQDKELKPFRRLLTIDTVDGFQGRERDVIIISLVRSNEQGNIGFLSDLRRMNVAITRARMKLIILGDAGTLGHHSFYKKLYTYITQCKETENY